MARFILMRLAGMIPAMVAISILSFVVIQLPPGDFVTTLAAQSAEQGNTMTEAQMQTLRERYGIGQPVVKQYFHWIGGVVRGDFGYSFEWNQPVSALVMQRMGMTALVSLLTLVFIWVTALPIGIYSAVRKYSPGDYIVTLLGFIGMATPNFLLAILMMYIVTIGFGQSVGGLFSPPFVDAPWSLARIWDFLKHVWIPVLILGAGGTAALIRVMRANLLDELRKPYVETALAKGLSNRRAILRYPVRLAINPFISTVGWVLPSLISGELIVSTVMNLPTAGPLLLQALKSQDMYLAGAFLLLNGALVLIGTLLSDILLAIIDPRIRLR
ncbi:ABC transporter permease [Allorhizobium sp. BGMRC 0089]|uniref:ABC transporter permease n=1 Tax=Allorhizobium sonneratiae TaxID=2934936 RepID=UPI0020332CC2|nr:ABC transporter permease [Allorhizobium sonneratiae]MCM2293085.1 ABC transporter permease [Allorhizobium sonneratiae]